MCIHASILKAYVFVIQIIVFFITFTNKCIIWVFGYVTTGKRVYLVQQKCWFNHGFLFKSVWCDKCNSFDENKKVVYQSVTSTNFSGRTICVYFPVLLMQSYPNLDKSNSLKLNYIMYNVGKIMSTSHCCCDDLMS